MPRLHTRVSLMATLLFITACTQPAAQIDLRGQNSYGRSGNGYAANASTPAPVYNAASSAPSSYQPPPVYTNTNTAAPSSTGLQSVGVSDLAPPPKTAKTSFNNSVSKATDTASTDQAQPINPWTKKSHFSDAASDTASSAKTSHDEAFNLRPQGKQPGREQMVSDVHPAPSEKPVAQLDHIISNDSTSKPVASKASKVADASGFMWPVNSKKVISGFGPKGGGKVNDGINIASAEGEPVWASADGEVVYVGNELAGYGNMVLIKHTANKTTTYAHLNRATVDKYDRVKQGDIIGYVGSTGNVKDPQLHFAIRDGKDPVDPQKFLKRAVASAE